MVAPGLKRGTHATCVARPPPSAGMPRPHSGETRSPPGWQAVSLHAPELGSGSPPRTRVTAPDPQGLSQLSSLDAELWATSGGNVARADPAGPVFRMRRRRRPTASHTFVRALNRSDRRAVTVLSAGWAASFVWFWTWWLSPGHSAGWPGLVLNSALLFYLTVTPAYFLIAALRLRRVDPRLSVPRLRVAFVVTRAPSEPWAVVRGRRSRRCCARTSHSGTTSGSATRRRTTGSWRGAGSTASACRAAKASRSYHRATWPRRTRCKEGNLAYFYDHWGYRDYDVVAQLDCDHVPGPRLSDRRGAAVRRPRCRVRRRAQRLRRERRRVVGGAWPAPPGGHHARSAPDSGTTAGSAPVCIGSHYAVRTAALREIGGFGPGAGRGLLDDIPAELRGLARRVRHRGGGPRRRAVDLRRHADPGVPVVAQPHRAAVRA